MARRELRPVTRLFTRRATIGARVANMLALTLAVGVVGFGVATALYLENPSPPITAPVPQTAAVPPATVHDPTAAAAAQPTPAAPPPAVALAAIEPRAGSSSPPRPAETVALAPPIAAPAAAPAPPPVTAIAPAPSPATAAKPAYWVEYGVFVGESHARRLQQRLARRGIAAVVVATHGRHRQKLMRVRSAVLPDLAAARQAAGAARQAVHVAALLHRGDPAAAPEPRYRVQFAAFVQPERAARLSRDLRRQGVATSVSKVREINGKPLYLVRSNTVGSRSGALALAARGRSLVHGDFLVEERPRRGGTHRAARAPPRPIADSR